jgi:hypothetical protein
MTFETSTRPDRRKAFLPYPLFTPKTKIMKRRQSITSKHTKGISGENSIHHGFPAFLADSFEVMENYYREKIQVLNQSLHQLNVMDNAREIAFVCREITIAKQGLEKTILKKQLHILKSR